MVFQPIHFLILFIVVRSYGSNHTISCPEATNCDIVCNSTSNCSQKTIICPTELSCSILCESGCDTLTINASFSSQLSVSGCSQNNSCSDLSIYCPPKQNATKKCEITGNRNIQNGMNIYAINGWSDVVVTNQNNYSISSLGMFCLSDYSQSCSVANNAFECDPNGSIICNDGVTVSPTLSPITSNPTTKPTKLNILSHTQ